MLVSGKKILDDANKRNYGIGAFNINNMEFCQAVAKAAVLEKSPVIIQTSEGAIDYAGVEYLAAIVKTAAKLSKVPICLHLDHGKDMDYIRACIKNGYTSIMIDGSHYEFDENIRVTKKVVRLCSGKGIAVEAELGTIGGVEDKVSSRKIIYTEPDAAVEFVKKTKVDSLAIAIGTSHGAYKFSGRSKLDIPRLIEIKKRLHMPIVLHGASSIYTDVVRGAERYGAKLGNAHGVSDMSIKESCEEWSE